MSLMTDMAAFPVDFPDQARLSLSADIKYKSNGQQAALKCQSQNKRVASPRNTCSFSSFLLDLLHPTAFVMIFSC